MVLRISASIAHHGYGFFTPPSTDQSFPVLPRQLITELAKNYQLYLWKDMSEELAAIRLITSWATREEIAKTFIRDFRAEHLKICYI